MSGYCQPIESRMTTICVGYCTTRFGWLLRCYPLTASPKGAPPSARMISRARWRGIYWKEKRTRANGAAAIWPGFSTGCRLSRRPKRRSLARPSNVSKLTQEARHPLIGAQPGQQNDWGRCRGQRCYCAKGSFAFIAPSVVLNGSFVVPLVSPPAMAWFTLSWHSITASTAA